MRSSGTTLPREALETARLVRTTRVASLQSQMRKGPAKMGPGYLSYRTTLRRVIGRPGGVPEGDTIKAVLYSADIGNENCTSVACGLLPGGDVEGDKLC